MTKKFCTFAAVFALLTAAAPTLAADDHEYKFVPMMKETTAGDHAIIIDEKTGDLWEYLNQPAFGKLQAINGVKYIGKLHPGTPGETIIGNFGFGCQ